MPNIDTHADDLAAFLGLLQITEPVVLAGIAVGAGIPIRFAVCFRSASARSSQWRPLAALHERHAMQRSHGQG